MTVHSNGASAARASRIRYDYAVAWNIHVRPNPILLIGLLPCVWVMLASGNCLESLDTVSRDEVFRRKRNQNQNQTPAKYVHGSDETSRWPFVAVLHIIDLSRR